MSSVVLRSYRAKSNPRRLSSSCTFNPTSAVVEVKGRNSELVTAALVTFCNGTELALGTPLYEGLIAYGAGPPPPTCAHEALIRATLIARGNENASAKTKLVPKLGYKI